MYIEPNSDIKSLFILILINCYGIINIESKKEKKEGFSMTANQIYKLPPIRIEKNTYSLNRFCDFHIPELNSLSINNKMNEKVELKFYADYSFDARRYWELISIWYMDKPVMIVQNAGREGSDHIKRFITINMCEKPTPLGVGWIALNT